MGLNKFAVALAFLAGFAAPALAQTTPEGHGPMNAQHHQMMMQGTMLTVSAEGVSEAAPDMAAVSLGVLTEAATAQAALAENARRMTALTQALRRAGVAERDIQTSNLSVNPQYVYAENERPRITGYQASNSVNARVRNLANVGRVVDGAVAAGGNTVNGISFSHQNPDAQLDIARRAAAAEARRRATLYAEAFGMRVHRIVAIGEGGGAAPPPMMMMQGMDARMAAAESTPVSPGELETRVALNVTFELR